MKIEYDEYYKCWVVWEVQGSGMFERFRGLKKDCKQFAKKYTKRERKNGSKKRNRQKNV